MSIFTKLERFCVKACSNDYIFLCQLLTMIVLQNDRLELRSSGTLTLLGLVFLVIPLFFEIYRSVSYPNNDPPLYFYIMFVVSGIGLLIFDTFFSIRSIVIGQHQIDIGKRFSTIQISTSQVREVELELLKKDPTATDLLDAAVAVAETILSDKEKGTAVFHIRGERNYKITTGETTVTKLQPVLEFLNDVFGVPEDRDNKHILNLVWVSQFS